MDAGISPRENLRPDNADVNVSGDPSSSCRHVPLCMRSKIRLDIVLFLFYDAAWERSH
jgi:hypothetical protein